LTTGVQVGPVVVVAVVELVVFVLAYLIFLFFYELKAETK
jgi:hypothetical protein